MGAERRSSLNRPCDFLAAKIPITCVLWRLLSQRADVSLRREKPLSVHCKQSKSKATPLWRTRFRMKLHSTSWACHTTGKIQVKLQRDDFSPSVATITDK